MRDRKRTKPYAGRRVGAKLQVSLGAGVVFGELSE